MPAVRAPVGAAGMPSRTLTDARVRAAAELAAELAEGWGLRGAPVDPFAVAATEFPQLVVFAEDFGRAFDGRLEYHPDHRRFLAFVNSRLDSATGRHPRTRFSLAHELGHFFLPRHHAHLRGGGLAHGSAAEFTADMTIEREADAFAASLLMPAATVRCVARRRPPHPDGVRELSAACGVSPTAAAVRCVELSDFPCCVGWLSEHRCWYRPSQALIAAGCYPPPRGHRGSTATSRAWDSFARTGAVRLVAGDATCRDWFRTFEREHLDNVWVGEAYLPLPTSEAMLVLLTMNETDLADDDDD